MVIKKIDIAQQAARLLQPFQMAHLGYVDDFAVSVFICQGTLDWHRHIDRDELFLVQSGVINLETEWGNVRLRPDEMAVVPKGVKHRSSSFLWSVVLLFQPQIMAHRKNGDRRVDAPPEGKALHKVNVIQAVRESKFPFQPLDLVTVDDGVMRLLFVRGKERYQDSGTRDKLFLVFEGEVSLDMRQGDVNLQAGEMIIIPKGMLYRLASLEEAIVLLFEKKS